MADHETPTKTKAPGAAAGKRRRRSVGKRLGNVAGRALYRVSKFGAGIAVDGCRDGVKFTAAVWKAVGKGAAHVAVGVGQAMAEDIKQKHQEQMKDLRQKQADTKESVAKKVDGLKGSVKKRVKGPRTPGRH